jgi:hypothetical protein
MHIVVASRRAKATKFLKISICALLMVSMIFCEADTVQAKAPRVCVQIDCVAPRTDKPEDVNDAVLILNFKNLTTMTVYVPFSAMSGKGENNKVLRRFFNLTKTRTSKNWGCSFCRIDYYWTDASGAALAGLYEPDGEAKLSSLANQKLRLPIKIPSEFGKYTLHVQFDNRNLEAAGHTYNSSQGDASSEYFVAKTEAQFEISKP